MNRYIRKWIPIKKASQTNDCSEISDYRKGNENAKSTPEIIECGFNMKPGEGQICRVNSKDLMQSNCTKDNKYGFEEGKPCILLKLNKVRDLQTNPQLGVAPWHSG